MKLNYRFYGLLALLLAGSAGLHAQGSDPFPDVNFHQYQGSMTITAQVVQNGEVITDAVVAVYCGDEIRGKKSVGSGTNPDLVYLTVYGHTSGTQQNLYFKVCTGGMTFTCPPDPAILFKNNDSRGTESDPCVITLPVSLANDADNSRVLTDFSQQTCDVILTGRSLYKDGSWNTLCLPFNLDLAGSVLEGDGVEVRTLSSTEFSDGTLTLNFTPATGEGAVTGLVAGTPYIIKWADSGSVLENPVFTDVTISSVTAVPVTTTYVDFVGTFSPAGIYTAANTNLFLGDGNTLYYPERTDYTVKAFRAYFRLKPGSGANAIRQFVLNFGDATEIETVSHEPFTINQAFDLAGRRIGGVPAARGIYIVNGRKVVIK